MQCFPSYHTFCTKIEHKILLDNNKMKKYQISIGKYTSKSRVQRVFMTMNMMIVMILSLLFICLFCVHSGSMLFFLLLVPISLPHAPSLSLSLPLFRSYSVQLHVNTYTFSGDFGLESGCGNKLHTTQHKYNFEEYVRNSC